MKTKLFLSVLSAFVLMAAASCDKIPNTGNTEDTDITSPDDSGDSGDSGDTGDSGDSGLIPPVMNTRESVDLGLTVKWATCNVGASKPEEKGQFFQWGSAKDVTDLSNKLNLENCPYHEGSSKYTGWTKYVSASNKTYWAGEGAPDGKTELDLDDDAAYKAWGGPWRTPTDAEWTELSEGCTWTWTNLEECYGYKVQSKKPGYTDKWIFLPAAGIRLNAKYDSYNECGYYWSSTVAADPNEAYLMFFSTSSIRIAGNSRYCGHNVRPVKE